jgi:YVTN family beta-propeller protein
VHPTTGTVYITSRANDRLLALNPFLFQVAATAETGDQPWGVAVDPVAESGVRGELRRRRRARLRRTTLAQLATIPVGPEATLVETLPELGAAFVLIHNGSRVAVIEGLARTADLTSGGSGPFGIAADHENGQVFISNRDSGHIATISRVNGAWVTRSNVLLADGRRLFELAYDTTINRLYIVYLAANQGWYVDAWKPQPWPALWGREATVAVESSGAITSPRVGGAGLAVNPATGYVYNANSAAGTVSVLDAGGGRVRETIPTLGDPFAIATDGARNRVYIGLRTSGRLIILK